MTLIQGPTHPCAVVPLPPLALPLADSKSFSGSIPFMMQRADVLATVLALFVLASLTFSFSQQKERNRKLDAAQKASPAASSAKDDKDKNNDKDKDKDGKNEGDPLFKGMKYRSIGPYPRRPLADRCWHPRRSDDLLFRRDRRRSLEIDRRSQYLVSRIRQRWRAFDRQHRRRRV